MTESEFREVYRQHKDVLYRFARRMTGSDAVAEDIVQDSFLLLWRSAAVHHPERGTLRSLLIGVARNLAFNRLRSDRPYDELEDDLSICGPVDLVGLERAEMVARAVAALPPLQREALILAEYEEMPLDEIGRATGADLAAVKSRLHRARQNLRRILEPLLERKSHVYGTHE